MRLVIGYLLLSFAAICSAQGMHVDAADTAQNRFSALIDKLRSNEIQRIEIVQIPSRILTRTRVTPAMLERSFHYKFIIRDIRGGLYASSLIGAVTSISAEPSSDMGNIRWGMTFFDQKEERIESFYFDASGRRGAVGSLPVSFRGDMFKWLDDNFGKTFK